MTDKIEINHVAVLGAGTMGGGIAALCANAGLRVLLLDVEQSAAEAAKARLASGRSPVITDHANLDRITCGALATDLERIAECQWICEAIVEQPDTKRALLTRVDAARAPGSLVTTNTSGIPLRSLYADMPQALQRDIAVTHFFNPAHLMKLVELVPGEHTRPEVIHTLAHFLSARLGKGVVYAKDTVNFIGNRIGCLWMLAGLHLAEEAMARDGLDIETVDALMSAPLGFPATGLYGLIDLIGLDVMYNVGKNLEANLPAEDAGRPFLALPKAVQRLYERGQLGRKSGGGFYKLTRHEDGAKTMEVYDLVQDTWRAARSVQLPSSQQTLAGLFADEGAAGRFTRAVLATTLGYAAELVPQIADDIVNVDRAMRWGFNWQYGPFELMDRLDADALTAALADTAIPRPSMLQVRAAAGAAGFYRNDGREYLTTEGQWAPLPAQ